jgi:hypothetical protein
MLTVTVPPVSWTSSRTGLRVAAARFVCAVISPSHAV